MGSPWKEGEIRLEVDKRNFSVTFKVIEAQVEFLQNIGIRVVYFDQPTGAPHAVSLVEIDFLVLKQFFPTKWNKINKKLKESR